MLKIIIEKLTTGHSFFCHKEQMEFEMSFELRKEKNLENALFSF